MFSRFTKMFIAAALALILLSSAFIVHPPMRVYLDPWTGTSFGEDGVEKSLQAEVHDHMHAEGHVIMPKLENATAKALLGQSTWRLLHTMTLRFPENPTSDERQALKSYFHLLSRLYPCGECAAEFQILLKQNPPQTSSRKSASLWLCYVHNLVNKRLKKPDFDCTKLDSTYDCGCGDPAGNSTASQTSTIAAEGRIDEVTGAELIKGG